MIATHSDGAPVNVLVVGVGGQGVLMVSKVLAQLCQDQGFMVKQSEVHGMAKRGGSVFSHVRFGREVWSPTIPRGQADVLLAMEWAEGLRWLPHLNPETGIFIADTRRIVPPFAFRNRRRGAADAYVRTTPADLIGRVPTAIALDATRVAEEAGNARAANTVLLGALSTALDFPEDDWQAVITAAVPAHTVQANLEAFRRGRVWSDDRDEPIAVSVRYPAVLDVAADSRVGADVADLKAEWRLKAKWCKGCNICVRMCPERCLALAGGRTAKLERPDACTACRLCEFLCPDLAITVSLKAPAEAPAL